MAHGAYLCALRFQARQLTAVDTAFAQQENLSVAIYGAASAENDLPTSFSGAQIRSALTHPIPRTVLPHDPRDRVCDPARQPIGLRRHRTQLASSAEAGPRMSR